MTSRADFLHPGRGSSWSWPLLGLGFVALSAVMAWEWQLAGDGRELSSQIAERQQHLLNQRRSPPTDKRPLAAEQQAQARERVTWPWIPTLAGMEATLKPPAYLLSLSMDQDAGVVKLEAEAPDFASAMSLVQGLADIRELDQVVPTQHSPATLDDGALAIRLSVTAQWRPLR